MGTGLTSLSGMVPGTDAYEFQSQLENLKAQVFLPTVKAMQGMGALSNAEGEKIAAAVENLKPGISQQEMARRLASLSQQMNAVAQNAKTGHELCNAWWQHFFKYSISKCTSHWESLHTSNDS